MSFQKKILVPIFDSTVFTQPLKRMAIDNQSFPIGTGVFLNMMDGAF
jgi:hypothetical protein